MRGVDELEEGRGEEDEVVDAFVRPHKIERTRRADIICISQHILVKLRLNRRVASFLGPACDPNL